jgi:CubicO group peptidase (beta-lactamase class C family)
MIHTWLSVDVFLSDKNKSLHMKPKVLFFPAMIIFMMTGPFAAGQSQLAEIDQFILDRMEAVAKPGLAACIIKDDSVVWSGNYGYAILEDSLPVIDSTIFNVFSIGKSLTASCVMQLWEDTIITLEEDVNSFLPFQVDNPHVFNDSISARMLLSHTSSINDNDVESYMSVGDPLMSMEYFLENYLSDGGEFHIGSNFLNAAPGTIYNYSNYGSALAGFLVEPLTGTDFDNFARQNLLDPLSMSQSAWFLEDLEMDKLAVGYDFIGNENVPYPHYGHPAYPGMSLRSTVQDLSRFVIMLMNGGLYDGNQVLEAATIDTMMVTQPPGYFYCLGFQHSVIYNYHSTFQRVLKGHKGGGTLGYAGEIQICPEDNTGIVYLSNSSDWMATVKRRLFDYAAMFIIALPAVDIDLAQFTAVWEPAPDATGYFLDVAMDENFENIVEDYLDKDVGSETSYLVAGLEADHAYYYRLRAYNEYDTGAYSNTVAVPIFTGNGEFQVPGSGFQVEVFPNPTSEIMHIEFEIRNPSPVRILVFNAVGGMVADLSDGILARGKHQITWNTAGLPAGLYFCKIQLGQEVVMKKIVKV